MTTHSDPQQPFGHDRDITQEFWGDDLGWNTTPDTAPLPDDGAPAPARSVRRWWNGLGSAATATRTHAVVAPDQRRPLDQAAPAPHEPIDDRVVDEDDVDHVDDHEGEWDDWDVEPSRPPRGGVDPLLARFGGLAVVLTLLVPVVLGFTDEGDDTVRSAAASGTLVAAPLVNAAGTPATPPVADAAAPAEPAPRAVPATAAAAATPTNAPVAAPLSSGAAPAATEEPTTAVPACAIEYEVGAGDYWIRIAEGSGTDLADVLAVNGATVETPLYPGRSICLPAGASVPPPPPPTTVPATTAPAPTTTRTAVPAPRPTPATAPATTAAPRPAAAPVPPPPSVNVSPEQVQAIIRSVWPDELEDRAIEVARRESTFRPTAKNFCCYGIFQIYWEVHRGWLTGMGITAAEQLYDPTTNARAALALYQRSGGWGPWGG